MSDRIAGTAAAPTAAQRQRFDRDGFLVIENFVEPAAVAALAERFAPLFRGEFPTGLYPDEWNWREGRDAPDLTRQICNGWKVDPVVAAVVLSAKVGRLCAELMGWPGSRIGQDNVLWKPPGAKALGFHQDDSYCHWVVPPGYPSCWVTLDDTSAAGGTIEYARGSHRWGLFPVLGDFHAPADHRGALMEAARRAGKTVEIAPIEVPAGSRVIHHERVWHGSGVNRTDRPRRSVVSHCLNAEARFHETEISYIYSRYRRRGGTELDESFFPVLWTRDDRRTPWLDGG